MAASGFGEIESRRAENHRIERRERGFGQSFNGSQEFGNCAGPDNMIRDAQRDDLERIIEMGRRFRGTTSYNKHLADNPERMKELALQLVDKRGLLVCEEKGELTG